MIKSQVTIQIIPPRIRLPTLQHRTPIIHPLPAVAMGFEMAFQILGPEERFRAPRAVVRAGPVVAGVVFQFAVVREGLAAGFAGARCAL